MQSLSSNATDRPLDVLIKLDHESLWNLYDRYLAAATVNPQEQQAIANELVREISVHSHAEETTVYGVIEAEEGSAVAEGLRNDHQRVGI
ncbi:hypothetical protein BCR44DRAFT_1430136 [Catenaria anguillulae PL171]|uniref:Hemerythrin-like domain-containing protein n=1 Tax=Catenaria anguillulae PL171 TaxID=765915 RepID=A0A1Y2HTF3_9FUNG|nr:hypothetical protein BCR44DRAFT_45718 [Catenaria anguillulae PL171]ORZ37881.1 hypothetical protein BCR44DRAFT_1430136 [Catenaria anguillulae PL171]